MTALDRLSAALADRYRIERELGQGGMATVYLAFDLRHDRRVALKVLKPELAAVLGADRFVQEIKTTAALQHPHILPLFDSGVADSFLYYVMPFIDGETLRSKLDRETQLGIDESIRIASNIADALDYAHRHGVIHRDIKPENILLHEGRPMVADFGIALAVSAAAGGRMTETGLSLGTPHYMSPEQATAEKEISARSDIYSLASVLYEMLAGQPPHTGASAQQIIMKIVTEEAAPVTRLRKSVPPNVAAAIAKGVEKLPADRFGSASEFADALSNPNFTTPRAAGLNSGQAAARTWRGWARDPRSLAAVVAIVTLTGMSLMGAYARRVAPHAEGAIRLTVTGPTDSSVLSVYAPVVSPDGKHVAFAVNKTTGMAVFVRALHSFELRELPNEGEAPFFSPDGKAVAFFNESELWSMRLSDQTATRIGTIPERSWNIGIPVWHPDGRILVAGAGGLYAIPAAGGATTRIVATDSTGAERFAEVGTLRDGRLLLIVASARDTFTDVLSADGRKRTRILPGLTSVRVVDDIVFFNRNGQRHAAYFDQRKLRMLGDPIVLTEDAALAGAGRSIAWMNGSGGRDLELVWMTREGNVASLGLPRGWYTWPRISPDGSRIATGVGRIGLKVIDLNRGTSTPLKGRTEPVWSTDGKYVYASTGNRPQGGLSVERADGSRAPDTILTLKSGDAWPTSVSPDEEWLAYYGVSVDSGSSTGEVDEDVRFISLRTREIKRLRLSGGQRGARFSPDGNWIAYQSTESGREEVHVRPWPALDANYMVSTDGGSEPAWSHDGRELFYRHRDAVMAVSFAEKNGELERTAPRLLFRGLIFRDRSGDQSYDVAPDGRFLMLRPVTGTPLDIQIALNWLDEIRTRLDASR